MKSSLGKIVRDSVHGDIFIENEYMDVINTKEFQRLRRINQLSVGNLVFPSAQHTRFSHSIGTFHLMKKIIEHIEKQFSVIGLKVNEKDKEQALLVALLHDIGHGPFSHAFEGVIEKNHEEWTKEIIIGNTEVNKVIKEKFGSEYPEELVKLISKDEDEIIPNSEKEINLFFVIKSLISSQLDADRLDYLVRDAINTGVILGEIDLSRIIKSIVLTEFENKIYVCVEEKNIIDIKSYLLARDDMHEAVYLHPIKSEMEEIVKLIFIRCRELMTSDDKFEMYVPEYLKTLIKNKEISLENYIYLDDCVIIAFIKDLLNKIDDKILITLCDTLINRKPFKQIEILKNKEKDINRFKQELFKIIYNNSNLDREQYKDNYFFVEVVDKHKPYKPDKEKIYVLTKDGTIKNLDEIVKGLDIETNKIYTAINITLILELIQDEKRKEVENNINKLISLYSNRNHVEIERKFLCDDIDIKSIIEKIKSYGLDIEEKGEIQQIDIYYDTEERYFYTNNITCRVRNKEDKLYVTIKTPTNGIENDQRFEYEFEVNNYEIDSISKVIKEYVSDEIFEQILKANKVLEVSNSRKIFSGIKNEVEYEISYDQVKYYEKDGNKYCNGNMIMEDNELEIELKSQYYHRIQLKYLADFLKENIKELTENKVSKYHRGIEKLKSLVSQ
ncbi:HD domain-containing protein [Clostridium sp.]|uniref:HD domain-containing protein n=1 Tax=Clostridium sp. TaxID=1506 RepID=UPI0035215FBE